MQANEPKLKDTVGISAKIVGLCQKRREFKIFNFIM